MGSNKTDYDAGTVAEQYREAKQHDWRKIETFSFLKHIGDVSGLKVIDLASGEGYFTRMLKAKGAAHVRGVELSQRMVDLAKENLCDGIEYECANAAQKVPQEDFDLATAAWLLVYCRTEQELQEMCAGIASRLTSGGRFVTVILNCEIAEVQEPPDFSKYQLTVTRENKVGEPPKEGDAFTITIDTTYGPLCIENYYLPFSMYEKALKAAGFKDVKFYDPELDPTSPPSDFELYADFFKCPILKILECIKE